VRESVGGGAHAQFDLLADAEVRTHGRKRTLDGGGAREREEGRADERSADTAS
jgi:hypothetical protein